MTPLSSSEVEAIRAAVALALAEGPAGEVPGQEEVARLGRRLTGHAERLLPLAESWNDARRQSRPGGTPQLVGYGLLFVRRMLEYGGPDARVETAAAYVWCQQLARAVHSLLDVTLFGGEDGRP
ncbi:hypothetical protein AB8O64_28785 [Streptomyces sp. QH1-20]|uniref:DUF6415 family natural product biosynthesis protein n=1 Tax=Streptomyces sp. QH1-20 TaxID=3240934 RepID=UPI0035170CF7